MIRLRNADDDFPDISAVMVKDYQLELQRLAEEGVIQPVISKIFSFEDIKEAYHCLDDRGNIGKIVISVSEPYQIFDTAQKR